MLDLYFESEDNELVVIYYGETCIIYNPLDCENGKIFNVGDWWYNYRDFLNSCYEIGGEEAFWELVYNEIENGLVEEEEELFKEFIEDNDLKEKYEEKLKEWYE